MRHMVYPRARPFSSNLMSTSDTSTPRSEMTLARASLVAAHGRFLTQTFTGPSDLVFFWSAGFAPWALRFLFLPISQLQLLGS
jgi:hypothetical protein